MNRLDIIHALEGCELFSGLEKTDIEKIVKLCQMESHEPGEYIFRQGEICQYLYVIAEGHVFLERSVDLGSRKGSALISILGRGRAFGCWSTLLDEPHRLMASAICQKPTKVIVINGADLRKMMLENVGLGLSVFRKLCYILRDRVKGAYGAMEKI